MLNKYIKPSESQGLIQVQGRKLKERLSTRVKAEQQNMKNYLQELAELKVKESLGVISQIRNNLKEPLGTLKAYVQYCSELNACRKQKDQLVEQKKKLDEMKGVLSKHKSKEEGY